MIDYLIHVEPDNRVQTGSSIMFTEDSERILFRFDFVIDAAVFFAIRADGATASTNAVIETIPGGSLAACKLDNSFTAVPGRVKLALRVTEGASSRVVWHADGNVQETMSGSVASAGGSSIEEIEKLIDRAEKAMNGGVSGVYPSLAALQAAVPSPLKGEHYLIGTSYPYAEYVWNVVSNSWVMIRTGVEQMVIETVTHSGTSCAAGTATAITIPAGKAGYTPVGIVGYYLGGSSVRLCNLVRWYINGNDAVVQLNNAHTAAVTPTVQLQILYAPGESAAMVIADE